MVNYLKTIIRKLIGCIQQVLEPIVNPELKSVAVVRPDDDLDEFERRLRHFVPELVGRYVVRSRLELRSVISSQPILLWAQSRPRLFWKVSQNIFNLDYRSCPNDAWNWFTLSRHLNAKTIPEERALARKRFSSLCATLSADFKKCYIFGTGTSLGKAIDHRWSDGARIVCNTICRDGQLWCHLDPHIVVAGDALYHFGHTPFAVSFRRDLRTRLRQTKTYFVYPDIYHNLVRREFADFWDRLVPIGYGDHRNPVVNLLERFELPAMGNVLNVLLLPIACTISKDVYLWGFDGRAPTDKTFWSNSTSHFYPEFVPQLQAAHPAFFEALVPKHDPGSYVRNVHGDELDASLSEAEARGWRFTLLHKSWTQTLQKRYRAVDRWKAFS